MKKILLTLITIFFIGCSSKVSAIFHKDDRYITLSEYTQRGQLIKSFDTIALINATYLNPILKDTNKTQNNEIFIIGIYNSDDYKGYKKGGIHNPHYILTMNDMNYTKAIKADIKKLDLTNYPFYNKWMKYYKVYFPKTNSNKLTIVYKNIEENATTSLTIIKDLYKIKDDDNTTNNQF